MTTGTPADSEPAAPPGSRWRDRIAGIAAAAVGIFVAMEGANYSPGTLARMGPGMLPVSLGVILALLGAAIALAARAEAVGPRVPIRPALHTLAAVLAFALIVERAGLIPATVVLVFIAGTADPQHTIRSLAALAAVLCVVVWLVFVVAIGIPFRLFVGLA